MFNIFGRPKFSYPPSIEPQVEKATHHLAALTTAHDKTWHIGKAAWSVDQDAGTITFDSNEMRVVAPVQIIGTYNTIDSTWLWGWDHPSVTPALSLHAKNVLAYGEKHDAKVITTRKVQCSEAQAWELTALACLLNEAQGAYRGPAGTTLVFTTFGAVSISAGATT